MKKLLSNTIFQLLIAIVVGIVIGLLAGKGVMQAVLAVKQVTGQVIFFLVPLVVFAFISSSIASLKENATKLLLFTFVLAYIATECAAFLSLGTSQVVLPFLGISSAGEQVQLPGNLFNLEIPPLMSVMSALVLAMLVGLGTAWIKSAEISTLLAQFREMVLLMIRKVMLPILPVYVASNFCALTYSGALPQMKVFLLVLVIIIIGQFIWLALLYFAASLYSGKNGWNVLKHYGPAYLTALGTMSSAASLGVALDCGKKSGMIKDSTIDFCIPLFNNIHLSGSVFTIVLIVSTVSYVLYGGVPQAGSMIVFVLLLGIFAIGAPGVPGGSIMAALGLITSVLLVPDGNGALMHIGDEGTSLLITIFVLQDSFGTACNLTGDGALALITDTYIQRHSY